MSTTQQQTTSQNDQSQTARVTVATLINAPIADVWNACVTPSDIKQWNAASDDWHTTQSAVDLRVGGVFSSRMEAKDGSFGFDFAGTYTKIVPDKLLESSFGDRGASVEFETSENGVAVRVAFDAESENSLEQQQQGWQAILNNFVRYVESKGEGHLRNRNGRITMSKKLATSVKTLVTMVALVAASVVTPAIVHAFQTPTIQLETPKPAKSGHINVNGVNYYYAVYGTGEPLLLLHGGLGQIEMFGVNLTTLAKSRQVIGVDLHGHGRTTLGTRDINLVDIGNDLAALVKKLGYDKVDVLGYSMGGMAALQLAAQHPALVRRVAIASAPFARNGFFAEMLPQQAAVNATMAEQMKDTPMYKSYVAIAPHPEDFPKLLDKIGVTMRTPYDWSADVKKLTMPVMLIYGDSDMIRPDHMVQFYQLLGGGLKDAGWQREQMSQNRLAILPNMTHYEIGDAPQLVETALPFLNGQGHAKIWDASKK